MQHLIHFDDVDEHGPQRRTAQVDLSAADLDRLEVDRLGPVKIDIEVAGGHGDGEYVGTGEVSYSADLRCSRCLDPFPIATVSPFTVRFRPRPSGAEFQKDEEIEISEDELDIEYYSDRIVSLAEQAAEQIQLSIPMKPLCGDDCLGLCATCGTNLNKESCSCSSRDGDERWAALRDIREQIAKKKQF
jgi:uncharacterized protein